jgi:DNA-binding LacI/PurR family transcriptional regulator
MPESKLFRPPLTTINHDFNRLGTTSLQIVTEAIANPDLPAAHHKIAPQLIVRETVSKI